MRLGLYLMGLSLFGLANSYFDIPLGGYLLADAGGICVGIAAMLGVRP